MASTQIDAGFYTHIPVKNFSIERIHQGLGINPAFYQTIGKLKSEMLRLDILGSLLNTEHAKSLLQQAFSAVELKYPTVFTPLPLPWKQHCLTAIAQKCNENKKKQNDQLQNQRHRSSLNSLPQMIYMRQPLRSMEIYITSGMDMPVTDELVWKIGMGEMYWQMPNIVLRVIPRVQMESKIVSQDPRQKSGY
jgi:hypothetical protein